MIQKIKIIKKAFLFYSTLSSSSFALNAVAKEFHYAMVDIGNKNAAIVNERENQMNKSKNRAKKSENQTKKSENQKD